MSADELFSVVKWRNRQRYWNQREWKILRKDRGPNLAVPDSIQHLPLWRKADKDVGQWRKTTPVLNDA